MEKENIPFKEILKEDTEKKINANIEIDDPEVIEYFRKQAEEITEKYKKDERFSEIIGEFERITKEQKFTGIVITENGKEIGIGGNRVYEIDVKDDKGNVVETKVGILKSDRDKIKLGKDFLENIKDLFETDKKFTQNQTLSLVKHERQHLEGEAGAISDQIDSEIRQAIITEQIKDYDTLEKRNDEINAHYLPLADEKAEKQRINATDYKDIDDFAKSQAGLIVFWQAISKGMDYLKSNEFNLEKVKNIPKPEFFQNYKNYKKEEILPKIAEQAEKIRQDLVNKYKKKL